ncbi:VOC family protein, partial [Pseudomonas aeruginosa]|nr:VOC family protein [Pseudomonas aeruginosa]
MFIETQGLFATAVEADVGLDVHGNLGRLFFLFRFDEAPGPVVVPEGWCDKVMHANLQIGDSQIM